MPDQPSNFQLRFQAVSKIIDQVNTLSNQGKSAEDVLTWLLANQYTLADDPPVRAPRKSRARSATQTGMLMSSGDER